MVWGSAVPLAAAAGTAATGAAAARGGLGTCFPREKKGTDCRVWGARVGLRLWETGKRLGPRDRAGRRSAGWFETLCSWVGKAEFVKGRFLNGPGVTLCYSLCYETWKPFINHHQGKCFVGFLQFLCQQDFATPLGF